MLCLSQVQVHLRTTMSATSSKVSYLRSLPAIRERSNKVHALAQAGKLQYFDYHPEKEVNVVDFCTQIIRVCMVYTIAQSLI